MGTGLGRKQGGKIPEGLGMGMGETLSTIKPWACLTALVENMGLRASCLSLASLYVRNPKDEVSAPALW